MSVGRGGGQKWPWPPPRPILGKIGPKPSTRGLYGLTCKVLHSETKKGLSGTREQQGGGVANGHFGHLTNPRKPDRSGHPL